MRVQWREAASRSRCSVQRPLWVAGPRSITATTSRAPVMRHLRKRHHRAKQIRTIARVPKAANGIRVSQYSGDGRKSIKLVFARCDGQKKHAHQINGLAINRGKINRLPEADQDAKWLVEAWEARMRDRNPPARTRRSQFLTLQKRVRNQFGR